MRSIDPTLSYTDADLFRGLVESNPTTLEIIYKENYPSVMRFVTTNSGEPDDARDLFQEALLAAWLNAQDGKFECKEGQSLGGYIFQIAKFKWLDKLKSKQHRSTMRLADGHMNHHDGQSETDLQEERIAQMKGMYALLDEKCKGILNAYYYEKQSLTEIGELLDHDAATVKTLKYRCMQKLKVLYSKNTNQVQNDERK